jgi:hypothetical protein
LALAVADDRPEFDDDRPEAHAGSEAVRPKASVGGASTYLRLSFSWPFRRYGPSVDRVFLSTWRFPGDGMARR